MNKQNPFQLSDSNLRLIRAKLQEKQALARGRSQENFAIFSQVQSSRELVALEFLYAFMPLVDLGDYSGELFLSHVRQSLQAQDVVPWGSKISGDLFLHFVLPYRITNETIEDYRPYFFSELFDRVKDLTMKQAVLEINYWCHEKATYQAADPRTISPLNLVKAARGRCGEESALLVCALRSLGIPARQVYTPRWAHTDSNHAWVEAWVDGEWYFLGACEPEAELNQGWFVGPAQRAMLVHTKVWGTIYAGEEERVQVAQDYTELNLLARYAPTRFVQVTVKDRSGQPAEGANVQFQVFNYGGFASLASLQTDQLGEVGLTVGRGDLLIHANSDDSWGSVFVQAEDCPKVEIILGEQHPMLWNLAVTPPVEVVVGQPPIDLEKQQKNSQRVQFGEALRQQYEASFIQKAAAVELGESLGLVGERVWAVLKQARGNWPELVQFLQVGVPEYGQLALELLEVLAVKDLKDTTSEILLDHLINVSIFEGLYPEQEYLNYLAQPRVSYEYLRSYRGFFQEQFSLDRQDAFRHNPVELKAWIQRNIRVVPQELVGGWPSPQGVFELKVGSILAQQILFVAMARSFGIPARYLARDGQTQYLHEDTWVNVDFTDFDQGEKPGFLILQPEPNSGVELEYSQNFSLALLKNQNFSTLRFTGLDEEAFNDEDFKQGLELSPGVYRLTTGRRQPNGEVQATLRIFKVEAGQQLKLPVIFQVASRKEELGLIQINYTERPMTDVVLAWLDLEREPTRHFLKDLIERRAQFEELNVPLKLYLSPSHLQALADFVDYSELPATVIFLEDLQQEKLKVVRSSLNQDLADQLPQVFVVEPTGVISYASAGYQIGIGAQLLAKLGKY